jgi:DNA-binding CsgD family transcriptional regulator
LSSAWPASGGRYSVLGHKILPHARELSPPGPVDCPLRLREREILQLVSEGQTTKAIAMTLQISPKTVKWTRRQIMDKLEIHTVSGLTKYAVAEGITTLDF